MSKVIINTHGDISIERALNYTKKVIEGGLVSKGGNGPQYCFATNWGVSDIAVYARKSKTGTHIFDVTAPVKGEG